MTSQLVSHDHVAGRDSRVDVVKALLSAGWQAKGGKPLDAGALVTAVEAGNLEMLDALLAAGVPVTFAGQGEGSQPMARIWSQCQGESSTGYYYFRDCNAALVKKLLAAGAPAEGLWLDSNMYQGIDGSGEMMNYGYLGMACRDADADSAKALIDAGAAITRDVVSAGLVLSATVSGGRNNRPLLELLLSKGVKATDVDPAELLQNGDTGVSALLQLLDVPAAVAQLKAWTSSKENQAGWTLLHCAARAGLTQLVVKLMANGWDARAKDAFGMAAGEFGSKIRVHSHPDRVHAMRFQPGPDGLGQYSPQGDGREA